MVRCSVVDYGLANVSGLKQDAAGMEIPSSQYSNGCLQLANAKEFFSIVRYVLEMSVREEVEG